MLADNHRSEIDAILAKYPAEHKRSAVMPLLFLAQREYGYVTKEAAQEIAELLDLEPTQVASLVGFYTLYYDKPGGKYRIQICTDLPCALRGAEQFAYDLCEKLDIELGGTTDDGLFTVEEVMCLASCDKAPMFQVQAPDGIHYHEMQSVERTLAWIAEVRERESDA